MRLSVRALAWTGAVLWGGRLFLTGLCNLLVPKSGVAFLDVIRSSLPGSVAG